MGLLIQFKVLNLWLTSMCNILGGHEVVIATKWLSILDKINWDFKLLTMKFLYLGKRVMLQGLQPNGSTFLEGDRLFSGTTIKWLIL